MAIDYNTLIDGGNFYPSTVSTPQVAKYMSYKTGWLIDYGMNVYNGHWADAQSQPPPPPAMFNAQNVNVAAWAEAAKSRGVDYAALTILNEYGFILYPSEVQYNMSQITLGNGATSPYYTSPYCVQPNADQNIIQKFISEFRARGIEPVAYIGLGGNQNTSAGSMWASAVPSARQELNVQYSCKVIQEIVQKFGFKYLWYDMADNMRPGSPQRFYDAAKSIDPNIVIIGNVTGEANFERFPYDIQSTEEYAIYGGNQSYKTDTRIKNGVTYYVPQEIVATPYGTMSQWYYYDDLCPVQPQTNPLTGNPPYTKMLTQPVSEFQGIIQKARDYKLPFFYAMFVDRQGNLVQHALDYATSINFSYPYNIKGDQPNILVAKQNASFESLGISEANVLIIYQVGNVSKSYVPGRSINSISGFEAGKGYYIIPKKNLDVAHSYPLASPSGL